MNQIDNIMEQAQVFASAWALAGGRFDSGDGFEVAEQEKQALRAAIEQALAVQPKQEPDYEVSDEENEQFSLDVSNFKGADPEATKYALEQFLKNRTHPQPKQEPVAYVMLDSWLTGQHWPDDCFMSCEKPLAEATPLYAHPPQMKHVCNLWINPETLEYTVDRCDHQTDELIKAYIQKP